MNSEENSLKSERKRKKDKKNEPVILVPQPSLGKDILSTVFSLAFMVAFVVFFLTCVGQRVAVEGTSMVDTLKDKDQLIVDCFSYRFLRNPKRYEIVVFRLKDKPDTFYVKRVIGLPGETVQIVNSKILINGEIIEDPYATQSVFPAGSAEKAITLGEDEYFVMGDNRTNSIDSRYAVGTVKRSQFVGRAICRILPFASRTSLIPEEIKNAAP
ncbi:MAG: signal peptidase I [Lachnospiraceae bacterium]|nr:signal peptidase I [Lachnospiraceae bacterium]